MIVEEPSVISHQPSGETLYERVRPRVDQAGAIHNCLRLALSQHPVQEGFY